MELHTLTKPQKSIWSMEQFFGDSVANITGSVIFDEPVDIWSLQNALNKSVEQCDSLRIRIKMQNGTPMQYIEPFGCFEFEILRFETQNTFKIWIKTLARTPFNLNDALYKIIIVEVESKIGYVLHLHHLTADAWALNLLVNRVSQNLKNEPVNHGSYLDYLTTERDYEASTRREKDKAYFMSKFEQCSEPVYLSGKHSKSAAANRLSLVIDKKDTAKIASFCAEHSVSPYSFFMNALAIYIYRIKGAEYLYIGTTVLNRAGKKERETAGMFINTVPVLFHIDDTKSSIDNINENTEVISSLFRHQKYQYNDLLKDIRGKYGFTDKLFDVMLNFQNAALDENKMETQWYFCGRQGESLNIHINDRKHDGMFHIDYDYHTELFTHYDIERLHGHLMNLICDMIENPNKMPQKLNLMSDEEYRKVVFDFNDTAVDFPKDKCIHKIFEEQAAKSPQKIAVIACDKTLTYRELNEEANKVAYNLIGFGVKPNDIVALKLPRESYLLSAIMGVLKSGAAFLPIDPDYPKERIKYILQDSNADICITQENINQFLNGENCSNPKAAVSSDNLCYCIYTSGSTGKPKGTLLFHKGLLNLIFWENNSTMLLPDRIALTTTITFDVFTQEVMSALLLGKSAILSTDSAKKNLSEFVDFIEKNNIELIFSTPTFFDILTSDKTHAKRILETVREIALAGEPFYLNSVVMGFSGIYDTVLHNQYGPAETHVISAVTTTLRTYCQSILNQCVHQLFEEQAEKTPDTVAVIFEDNEYTYRQINEMANSLAHFIREKGINRNDIVAIIAKRSYKIIVAQLAVLKAGGAYLPIDPNYPKERIDFMLEDANCKIALTLGDTLVFKNTVDMEDDILFWGDITAVDHINTPDDLCYVIYTSGSTGKPKGVMLPHQNVVNYCNDNNKNIVSSIIKPEMKSILSITTIGFDIFVTESLLPLLNGKTIILTNDHQSTSQKALNELIFKVGADVLQTTPSKMEILMVDPISNEYLKGLKAIILCGETLDPQLVEKINKYTDAKIFNIYGPTETTVWSTKAPVFSETDITIGKPIANTQIYILDKHYNPLPIGAAGELCIAGAGVGKGYLNRPELTAEKFVDNPFGKGKMYKTGDLARWCEDGNIEYIGRMDNQVKIRGLRIELGEIESAIAKFSGIRQTAVVDKKDENGRQYICAYYIGDFVDLKALKAEITKILPRYMVPHFFIKMEQFPTTPSGKTDRKAFPVPDFNNIQMDVEYVPPVTEEEKALVALMEKVLGVTKIGLNDNFFDLGGDSLKAIELVSKAHHDGIYFNLQDVFDYPVIAMLLARIGNNERQTVRHSAKDFADIHNLLKQNTINSHSVPAKQPLGDILITGATGWLGSHVLDVFLSNESGKAYCLVRGNNLTDAAKRLCETLKHYFGDKYTECDRIIPVCGDITEKIMLDGEINAIIHSAATVKHYGTYQNSYDINVIGTKNIISLAKEKNAKLFHISTTSVSGNSFDRDKYISAIFDETCLYIGQPLDNIYVRSKFESEVAVLQAKLEGLEAAVVRVGNLSNRSSDFKFQQNHHENATLTRLKAFVDLGLYPEQMADFPIEFSPVDLTAKAIIKLAQYYGSEYSVFHAYNSKRVRFDKFASKLKIKSVTAEEFKQSMTEAIKNPNKAHIHEAFINDAGADGQLKLQSGISLSNDFTAWYLKQTEFNWSDADGEYLDGYIRYFNNIGYWGKRHEK